MSISDSAYRAPFVKVRIGPPNGKTQDLITLPESIARLLDAFEYFEVMDGGKESASRITLTFIEAAEKGQDFPGRLLDLRFDGASGVKQLSRQEAQANVQQSTALIEAEQEIQTGVSQEKRKSAAERKSNLAQKIAKDVPMFLLQERNLVEVTWGYRNPFTRQDLTTRTVRGTIQRIVHRASSSTIATTEIYAVDLGQGEYSKLNPNKGFNFTISAVSKILENEKNPNLKLSDYATGLKAEPDKPARVDDVVKAIASKLGADVVMDLSPEELQRDVQDANSGRTWAQTESLHEYLKSLAEKCYAHYYVEMDKNGKEVIHFRTRSKVERAVSYTFGWKGAGATLPYVYNTIKEYTLSLFPDGGEGATSSGVDSENKEETGSDVDVDLHVVSEDGKARKAILSDARKRADMNASAFTGYNPSSSVTDHSSTAIAYAGRLERALRLDMTIIGFPGMRPGSIKILGIGTRYSGIYYALSVTHRINAREGYLCTIMANTSALAAGGVQQLTEQAQVVDPAKKELTIVKPDGQRTAQNILETARDVPTVQSTVTERKGSGGNG